MVAWSGVGQKGDLYLWFPRILLYLSAKYLFSSIALLISDRPNILEWILSPNFQITLKLLTLESVFLGKKYFLNVLLGSEKCPEEGVESLQSLFNLRLFHKTIIWRFCFKNVQIHIYVNFKKYMHIFKQECLSKCNWIQTIFEWFIWFNGSEVLTIFLYYSYLYWVRTER